MQETHHLHLPGVCGWAGWYVADSYDSTAKLWKDISGRNNHANTTGVITLQPKGLNGGDAALLAGISVATIGGARAQLTSRLARSQLGSALAHRKSLCGLALRFNLGACLIGWLLRAGEDFLRGPKTTKVIFPHVVTTAGNYTLFHVCR